MQHTIKHKPSYALLHVDLQPGDCIQSESGSMVYMNGTIDVSTNAGGSILSALARKILGGESFFFNNYTVSGAPASLGLAGPMAGDIQHLALNGQRVYVQGGSFLCATPGISMKTKFGGLRSLLSGEGLFLLRVEGTGDLFLSSYGSIIPIEVENSFIVDTGHIVAFEDSLEYNIRRAGNWKSTFFSGEGLVTEFTGRGTVWIQTRVPSGFIQWLIRLLPGE
ncbi:MAG: TIGR00266 family protein [Spirochaetota bacterium]